MRERVEFSYDDFVDLRWLDDNVTPEADVAHCILGIAEEAGEVCGKYKKFFRGDGPLVREDVMSELGDLLFYITKGSHLLGYTLEDVMKMNVRKLRDRAKRGVIRGEGDDR